MYCHSQLVELLGKITTIFQLSLTLDVYVALKIVQLMINLKTEENLSTFARNENS